MAEMRILITGSRNWEDKQTIHLKLEATTRPDNDVIVHGDCPTGADRIARDWAILHGVQQEPHPADWETHGKAAGPLRNQEMVDLGAELCLAFPLDESRGTRDCMRRAEAAGITVLNYGDPA